ncbi:uncharacterized protein LOC115212146 [Octopus sinensis]|uniref:Uncharacterized protein LOC115212146 n=1 Tax=Octopus sinensis TaxID=2607531 RepID=A0A6P7SES6_9MOLL|nr:uncharacterized protein LOC115212146 [Octopus sinensis]
MVGIGIQLRAGLNNDAFKPFDELLSTKTGPAIYRAPMSRNRFKELKRCITFEEMSTCAARKNGEHGKRFIQSFQINYKAAPYITIHESPLSLRGKYLFKVYMQSKPSKYGLRLMLADIHI